MNVVTRYIMYAPKMELPYDISLKFLQPLDLQQTYKTVVEEAMRFVGKKAKYGSIFIPKGNIFQRVYTSYPPLYKIIPRRYGNTAKIFRSQNYRLVDPKSHEFYGGEFKKLG